MLMLIKPGEDFAIRFRNKTADERTEKEMQDFIVELKNLGVKYDFGSPCFGSWEAMRRAAIGEQKLIDKLGLLIP